MRSWSRRQITVAEPVWVLCTTTVIPAKAGIQRGRATECKAKRRGRFETCPYRHQGRGLCTAPVCEPVIMMQMS